MGREGAVVEVAELVAGDVVGIGGEVHPVVGSGSVVVRVELADEGVESLEAEIAGAVAEALSHEAVDPGSEVEWVGHGLGFRVVGTFVLIVAGFGSGGASPAETAAAPQ